jgi:hypothetical protein
MGTLLFLAICVVAIAYFLTRKKPSADPVTHTHTTAQRSHGSEPGETLAAAKAVLASAAVLIYRSNEPWLSARWHAAKEAQRTGNTANFPKWYFDPITDRQRSRLKDDGFQLNLDSFSKGNASDLIGLMMPPEPHDEEVLRFFNSEPLVFNQTRAREEAKRLLADAERVARWEGRPADSNQRNTLRAYGAKIPKNLTTKDANALIEKTEKDLAASNPELLARAQATLSIMNEIDDPETRETYGFKKPPIAVVHEAIRELEEEGRTLDDLAGDIYSVAEKILELRPDLERSP